MHEKIHGALVDDDSIHSLDRFLEQPKKLEAVLLVNVEDTPLRLTQEHTLACEAQNHATVLITEKRSYHVNEIDTLIRTGFLPAASVMKYSASKTDVCGTRNP